ncbi:MAG: prepilin-type N-terminal cleavage/methylation domain-containing protein [Verrucomicrobia bacterium]|nr:prepilin-type N-terminal cleavage/methylation domain-containing protein [Verrucomicrobiota bacterium]
MQIPKPARRAFSLVELLVVIAILALPASISVPAVRGALENSQRAKCASNMKSIGAVEHVGALELEIGQHVGETHTHYPLENSIIHFNFLGEKTSVTVGTTNLGSVWVTPETEEEADSANMPFVGFSA